MKIQELYEKASDEVKEKVDELLKPVQFVKGWNYIEFTFLGEREKWIALDATLENRQIRNRAAINTQTARFFEAGTLGYIDGSFSSRPATEEEVKTALIKVAKSKGFVKGLPLKQVLGFYDSGRIMEEGVLVGKIRSDFFLYHPSTDSLNIHGATIYRQGQWAEIVKEEPTPEDLKHRDEHYKSQSPEVLNKRIEELEYALSEARLQIEYLHDKFEPTGSGEYVLSKIYSLLNKPKP